MKNQQQAITNKCNLHNNEIKFLGGLFLSSSWMVKCFMFYVKTPICESIRYALFFRYLLGYHNDHIKRLSLTNIYIFT